MNLDGETFMVMKDAELTTYLFLFSHLEKLHTKNKIK